ncbi:hypothetical protein YQE_06051, partial [Dendroctonus ponderosae]
MGDHLPLRAITPERQRVRNKIVMYHNYFRSRVEPKASNMLKMKVGTSAAMVLVGKISSSPAPKFLGRLFAIETWWLEKDAFKFGGKNNMTLVGHYTQMVWATTHEVGCGLSKCYRILYDKNGKEIDGRKRVFYNYICNYCPIGNRPGRTSFPYKLGNPCSSCKKQCSKKLCLNSCDVSNVWGNCRELNRIHPTWLCRNHTPQGKHRHRNCRATCTCGNRIYDF